MLHCNSEITTQGSFTLRVRRIGATGTTLPYQLFGALDGSHQIRQTGILQPFVPAAFATNGETMVSRINVDGNLEIIDTATGNGVEISTNKVPYYTLLQFLIAETTPNDMAIKIAKTKLTYTVEESRQEQLLIRNRSYFEDLQAKPIDIDDYFEANQEQSLIVNIPEMIYINPVTKIDSTMSANETLLVFTFTLKVG